MKKRFALTALAIVALSFAMVSTSALGQGYVAAFGGYQDYSDCDSGCHLRMDEHVPSVGVALGAQSSGQLFVAGEIQYSNDIAGGSGALGVRQGGWELRGGRTLGFSQERVSGSFPGASPENRDSTIRMYFVEAGYRGFFVRYSNGDASHKRTYDDDDTVFEVSRRSSVETYQVGYRHAFSFGGL